MKKLLTHCNMHVIKNRESMFCEACCMGKSHKLPFKSSSTVYSAPLQLIEADLWGPAPIASNMNFQYYAFLIGDYLWFSWI